MFFSLFSIFSHRNQSISEVFDGDFSKKNATIDHRFAVLHDAKCIQAKKPILMQKNINRLN